MLGHLQNLIPNGDLGLWDAGPEPREMDTQLTATVLFRLQSTMEELNFQRHLWAEMAGREDKFTYGGESSLRAILTAASIIDDFRIHPTGINALAWTGASGAQIATRDMTHRYAFTFAARTSTDGNIVRARIVLRTAADAVVLHLQADGVTWAAADAGGVQFELLPRWGKYSVHPLIPQTDGAGNVIENMIWQLSNGTAGLQVLDLDDFEMVDLDQSFTSQ